LGFVKQTASVEVGFADDYLLAVESSSGKRHLLRRSFLCESENLSWSRAGMNHDLV
jgi:hypothetical protein